MGSWSDFRQREAKNAKPKKSRAQRAISDSPAIDPKLVKPSERGTLRQAENIVRTSSSPAEVERRAARAAERRRKAKVRKTKAVLRSVDRSREKRSQSLAKKKAPKSYKAPKVKRPAAQRKGQAASAGTSTKATVPKKPVSEAQALSKIPKPNAKPKKFAGKPTAGTPTYAELKKARDAGRLKTNRKGAVTTPRVRRAARKLKRAKRAVKKSGPSLAGLAPQEAEVVKYARKAHRKHPDIPVSLLMSLMRQESGFQADAVSSANAQGLTQFIPSTAAAYGVKYGTGKKEKQSQVTGAAKLLSDNDFASDPKGALTNYTGGYSDAEYNDPVLQGAADYRALDKPGNPKAQKKLKKAKAEAEKVGLPVKEKRQARKTPTIIQVGKVAEKKFGLRVGEHPYFDQVDPVHTSGSYHYSGQAIDVSGDSTKLAKFNKWVAKRFGDTVAEMFYDPGISIDNGVPIGPIGGHGSHVHVAIDEPGTKAYGMVAEAQGLPASGGQPFAYYGSGSSQKAAVASANRARKAALTPTQKAKRKLSKLESLGVGVGTLEDLSSPSESGSSGTTTLAELERRYLS